MDELHPLFVIAPSLWRYRSAVQHWDIQGVSVNGAGLIGSVLF